MLKFTKKGKKVMEMSDNGDIKVTDKQFAEKLKDFIIKENVTVEGEEKPEEDK
jgi:hypothetical protein